MWAKLKSFFSITAIRLSIIYTLIVGLVGVGIVAYMTQATSQIFRQQFQTSIDKEIEGLARHYRRGGTNRLFRILDRRARAPDANLYVVTNAQGKIVAGNVSKLQRGVMQETGWSGRPFHYERYEDEADPDPDPEDEEEAEHHRRPHRAVARVIAVPNGMRILVGRDLRGVEGFREIVEHGMKLAIGAMLVLGLLTWIFVGRRALKRIDEVTKSSQRILNGDMTERLPVMGSSDEFDRLSNNLNKMLDQIYTLDESLKQMSVNIAHDLKTPITRLRNKASEALEVTKDKKKTEKLMSEMLVDCDQIVKTFDALLMISRMESGSTVVKLEPVDVTQLLSDAFELYEAVAEEEGVKLELDLDENKKIMIDGNRELLSQAISNLIDNALKYGVRAEGESEIVIKAGIDKDEAMISIADDGEGIASEDRTRVLDRFTRLDKSRNKSGNGLGLSLVKAIVELHNGELSLADNDPGLAVNISMPLLQE